MFVVTGEGERVGSIKHDTERLGFLSMRSHRRWSCVRHWNCTPSREQQQRGAGCSNKCRMSSQTVDGFDTVMEAACQS